MTPVLCVENTKQMKLQGIVLTAPRATRFQVIVRDQNGANPFVRKRYVVQGPTVSSWGQCVDYRPWPLALVKWGANKEICVMVVSTFASGVPYTADLELLELMG